jgi:hypothetical protein
MARRILYPAFILLLGASAAEVVTRVVVRPRWANPVYVEISRDFDDLEALMEDAQKTYGTLMYFDHFLYATAPVATAHVNFTDYYSARLTPDSVALSQADHIIWAFGGSTLENTETTDTLTIANTWGRVFNRTLAPTHVKNFGTGGFSSSYELIKFQKLLREVEESEIPDLAIFYDGFNDALLGFQYGAGRMQGDLSLKLQAMIERKDLMISTYSLSRMLSRYSKFWERTGARVVESLLVPLPRLPADSGNLDATIRVYASNVRMIRATCDSFQIRCFFVLQPLLVTKTPLSELEREVLSGLEAHPRFGPEATRFVRNFYAGVVREFGGSEDFVDASHILDRRTQSDFYDLGHTSALTSPVIGDAIAGEILARIGAARPGSPAHEH